jgi:hypothetical protein
MLHAFGELDFATRSDRQALPPRNNISTNEISQMTSGTRQLRTQKEA